MAAILSQPQYVENAFETIHKYHVQLMPPTSYVHGESSWNQTEPFIWQRH